MYALPFDKLADLAACGVEHGNHIGIDLRAGADEELHDRDDVRTDLDRKAKAHANLPERGRCRRVHLPFRPRACPDATRQAEALAYMQILGDCAEASAVTLISAPEVLAFEILATGVDLPERSDAIAQSRTDYPHNLADRIWHRGSVGQDPHDLILNVQASLDLTTLGNVGKRRDNARDRGVRVREGCFGYNHVTARTVPGEVGRFIAHRPAYQDTFV